MATSSYRFKLNRDQFHRSLPSGVAYASEFGRNLEAVSSEQSSQFDLDGALPTVLIAGTEKLRARVAPVLEGDGYFVLEAGDEAEALHVVISQTRSIHILLADVDLNGKDLVKLLSPYRPEMRVFLVASQSSNSPETLNPVSAVAKVRECLRVPEKIREQMSTASRPGTRAMRMIA